MKLFSLGVLFALLLAVSCQDAADCPTQDDAASFEEDDIYKTASFLVNEKEAIAADDTEAANINEEYIMKKQAENALSADLTDYIKAVDSVDAVDDTTKILPYYYPVCPSISYWLYRYRYYYRYITVTSTYRRYTYVWPYYRTWVTRCLTHYCHINYTWWNWWDWRYRCFPVYRYVWTWATVYEVTYYYNGEVTRRWSSRLIRIRVPRGCSCRRYWPLLAAEALQCPATTKG